MVLGIFMTVFMAVIAIAAPVSPMVAIPMAPMVVLPVAPMVVLSVASMFAVAVASMFVVAVASMFAVAVASMFAVAVAGPIAACLARRRCRWNVTPNVAAAAAVVGGLRRLGSRCNVPGVLAAFAFLAFVCGDRRLHRPLQWRSACLRRLLAPAGLVPGPVLLAGQRDCTALLKPEFPSGISVGKS
jgi:hypothetical protein